jgi:GTP cyclohydrolase IA
MTSIPSTADRDSEATSRRLRIAPAAPVQMNRVDVNAAERAAGQLLVALGADLQLEGLWHKPRRMAAAYAELLTPEPFDLTTFPNEEDYDELVLVRDIPFQSLCMHHLLPFHGVAYVAYLPGERILGLSKLARVVEHFSRDLQLQERLTTQVAACCRSSSSPKASASFSKQSTCVCRCGERKSPAQSRSPRRCTGSSVTIRARATSSSA